MKIIGIDQERSSPADGMGERYLELDGYPPGEWPQFFDEVHANFFSTSKRRARVDGKYLVVNCPLDEIQHQINELKTQVIKANKQHEEYLIQRQRDQDAYEAALKEQKNKAQDVFKKLDF
ncbi:hypothetical protein JY555_14455 [Serratia marcescens]|nr:hypothetical protein [Serratia marcescens]